MKYSKLIYEQEYEMTGGIWGNTVVCYINPGKLSLPNHSEPSMII